MESVVHLTPNTARYKLVSPDGGWGYVVTVSFIFIMFVSVIPWTSFGIYYGPFLASIIGDETNGTFMMSSVLMAVMSFTGFASSFLLKKYNVRMVGLIGAFSYSVGGFSVFFATNMAHSVFCYSLLQGFGYGLLLPSSFTILNSYFDKKLSLVMSVSQMIIIIGAIICPLIMSHIVEHLGFRNVLLVLAGLSLLNFPAVALFRPVDRYVRKKLAITPERQVNGELLDDQSNSRVEPLLQNNVHLEQVVTNPEQRNEYPNTLFVVKTWLLDTIGLRLFGDVKYLNMAIGLAISSNTDFSFTTYIRMILNNLNFSSTDIAMMTMSYFCCDLVARIVYSVLCYFRTVDNRTIFLTATFVTSLFRIAFVLYDGYTWKIITIGLVGFSRGFIETPLSLVVSAVYKNEFSTAYSLYLVISGCLGLIFGAIISLVKNLTQSDAMIIYFFAIANFIACLGWITESLFVKLFGRKSENMLES